MGSPSFGSNFVMILTRMSIVGGTFVAALVALDYVGEICSLAGATFGSLLCFILPPAIHLKLFRRRCSAFRNFLHFFLIFFGVAITIFVTTDNIEHILERILP
ncbi:hypothetical protein GEMRC1_002213 [Eukaryota sp. GEM-RC1]